MSPDLENKLNGLEFSDITWKQEGEHAVTAFSKYDEKREFVKLVGLTEGKLIKDNNKPIKNENRINEIHAIQFVDAMINGLEVDDFRRECFVGGEVVIVEEPFPTWAKPCVDEYYKHVSGVTKFAFLFMRDLSGCVPLWRWWNERNAVSKDLVLLVAQIVWALKALADAGITHNDLHWNNIMVEEVSRQEISFVEEDYYRTFTQRLRPVLFDWDRAVMSNESEGKRTHCNITTFDPHYDLLGFYKNLTQKYKKLRMWWRFILHPFFEDTLEAFPSFAVDHQHHANPCLNVEDYPPPPSRGGSDTEQVNRYNFSNDYRFNRCEPRVCGNEKNKQFRKGCLPNWNKNDRWVTFEKKPSHEEIVNRLVHFLKPEGTVFINSKILRLKNFDPAPCDAGDQPFLGDEEAASIERELEMLELAEGEAEAARNAAAEEARRTEYVQREAEKTAEKIRRDAKKKAEDAKKKAEDAKKKAEYARKVAEDAKTVANALRAAASDDANAASDDANAAADDANAAAAAADAARAAADEAAVIAEVANVTKNVVEEEAERLAADALVLIGRVNECATILDGIRSREREAAEAVSSIARAKIKILATMFVRTLYVPLMAF